MKRRRHCRFAITGSFNPGFTIVELLVVLAIIGALVAMLLPAIQAARESARAIQCRNNIKQLSLALLEHEVAFKTFPYGGWGHAWVGVAEQGSGKDQPGGWAYSLLPRIEQQSLHDLGEGMSAPDAGSAFAKRHSTAIAVFVCPTRREAVAWPAVSPYARSPLPFGESEMVARSDYAINGGASNVLSFVGPSSIAEGLDYQYWTSNGYTLVDVEEFSGICHLRLAVSAARIEDGLSNTYLMGEKHVWHLDHETGLSPGDNESMYHGYSLDGHRFTGTLSSAADDPTLPPLSDYDRESPGEVPAFARFGSSHPMRFHMAFCDGSVRSIGYDVDSVVHLTSGHRFDGTASGSEIPRWE